MRLFISIAWTIFVGYSLLVYIQLNNNPKAICKEHPTDKNLYVCSHFDIELEKEVLHKNFKDFRAKMAD